VNAPLPARRRLPRRYRWRILALVLIPSVVAAPWAVVRVTTASAIQPSGSQLEPADVALILGAKVHADGRPSRFLRERVEAGVALYLDGTVSQLIMSGDGNASEGYSEPEVMKQIAIDMGVPADAILVDPLGIDTYSSCLRARDVYGVTSMIVVSQEFHLARAVWIAERLGIPARGVYPAVNYRWSTLKGHVREVAAVAKAVMDVYGKRD